MIETTGVQTLLGIVVDLADVKASISSYDAMLHLEEVAEAYAAVSRGVLRLGPLPGFRVALTQYSSANIFELQRHAAAKLLVDGIDIEDYDRRVWFFGGIRGPGLGGEAYIGAHDAYIYNGHVVTVAHEIGHNLGLRHAGSHGGPTADATTWMGTTLRPLSGLTAPERAQLNWLPGVNLKEPEGPVWTGTLTDLDARYPKETTQVLRLWAADMSERLWIAYRGAESRLPAWSRHAVHAHRETAERYWLHDVVPSGSELRLPWGGVLIHEAHGDIVLYLHSDELGKPPEREEYLPLQVTTPREVRAAVVGEPYVVQLEASGGAGAPEKWSLIGSGSLPPGLQLEPSGRIWGTPTRSEVYHQRIRVRDKNFSMASKVLKFRVRRP